MIVVELTIDAIALEGAITVLLAEGAHELEIFDEESPPVLAVLFDASDPDEVRERLSSLAIPARRIDVRAVSQVESSSRWCLRPLSFGPLWIVPPGRALPGQPGLIIESLGAGVFGSGAHATTALCLEKIIERSPIESLLDVGTGSGILALAALALGARSVLGTENDPAALALARKNAKANGFADRLELAAGFGDQARKFSVIAANILAGSLIDLAPELVRRLDSQGLIMVSGVRESELDEVGRAYRNFGLRAGEVAEREGWYRLDFSAAW